jgi:hypothetical protein
MAGQLSAGQIVSAVESHSWIKERQSEHLQIEPELSFGAGWIEPMSLDAMLAKLATTAVKRTGAEINEGCTPVTIWRSTADVLCSFS